MDSATSPATVTVTVYTRHSPACPNRMDRYWRKCRCRKACYIYEGGEHWRISARTRSWEKAEEFARAERDRRDPVQQRLREIERAEAERAALHGAKANTIPDSTERWLRAQRWKSKETETIYRCAAKRINTWAADLGVAALSDVTADMLDEWRGMWSPTAEKKYNRIGLSSQSAFLG